MSHRPEQERERDEYRRHERDHTRRAPERKSWIPMMEVHVSRLASRAPRMLAFSSQSSVAGSTTSPGGSVAAVFRFCSSDATAPAAIPPTAYSATVIACVRSVVPR